MGHETNVFFLFRLLLFRFITRLYVKELIRTLTHAIWFTYASHSIQYRKKIVNPMWTYSILFCSPSSYRCIDGPATKCEISSSSSSSTAVLWLGCLLLFWIFFCSVSLRKIEINTTQILVASCTLNWFQFSTLKARQCCSLKPIQE